MLFSSGLLAMMCTAAVNPCGLMSLLDIERLPFYLEGTIVHYEGSIDKLGGNADWDWWLYEENGEWVIFDVKGPGCLCNFVQHRYPTSEVPVFRFYFDGETTPRFEIRPEEFGTKAPFLSPLADIYEGPDDNGRGPIWVIRSFVPMPFQKACKVTSSVRLEGNDKARGEGGWGHVVCHRYATAEGIETFTGREDASPLLDCLKKPAMPEDSPALSTHAVPAGERVTLLDTKGEGVVRALMLRVQDYTAADLADLWIRMQWDNHRFPDVDLPLGAFFGNLFGNNSLEFAMCGMRTDGSFFSRWPMPYWEHARIELANLGTADRVVQCQIESENTSGMYPQGACGYFRTSRYYPQTLSVRGHDTVLAEVSGRGHIVAGIIQGASVKNTWASCEGDVRLYIDGCATPQIESDGSESWSCYGWGFPTPPENNPLSGYDGSGPPLCEWSMMRTCLDAVYPFRTGFRFCIEAHGHNDAAIMHAGAFFYYGDDHPAMIQTDHLDIGHPDSEHAHAYRNTGSAQLVTVTSCYENDEDLPVQDTGRAIEASSAFTVRIHPDNTGVRLARRSDQRNGRQHARVSVDGVVVSEGDWYVADRNPHCRWLEDGFEVPAAYTRGKDTLRIEIKRVGESDSPAWSEFRYWVYSHLPQDIRKEN